MFSRIVAVIVAVNFIFLGSGQEMNLLLGDLQPVLDCYKAGEDAALAYVEALGERPDTDADKIKATCLTLRVRTAKTVEWMFLLLRVKN